MYEQLKDDPSVQPPAEWATAVAAARVAVLVDSAASAASTAAASAPVGLAMVGGSFALAFSCH